MKKIVTVTEVEGEGLESLLGEPDCLLCMNDKFVLLEDAALCYETGEWTAKTWKDAQKIGQPLYVMTDKIEAYCRGK